MTDVLIVGGGPAGLTAALYAARAGCSVRVLERGAPGGQICYSPLVENYPALPGTSGAQLAEALTAQAEALGVAIDYADAAGAREAPGGYAVDTDAGEYQCRALVLAPGTEHRKLGLDGEDELSGVSYCAVCDGAFYKDKDVAVVGGGNTALQEALFLTGVCAHVTLVHRRAELRGEARLAAQLLDRPNARMLLGWVPERLLGENGALTGLALRNTETGEHKTLDVDGLFVAVGQMPGTAPFADFVDVDENGWFAAGEDCRTRRPGVFVAGDCRAKSLRQLTTAVADGAVAGASAFLSCASSPL